MSNKCMCCKSVLKSNKCSYCGYESDAAFVDAFTDEESANREWNKASSYCNNILSKLSGFSVMAHKYKWNASKEAFDSSPSKINLPQEKNNGKALAEGIVFTNPIIAQVGIGEEQELEINYSVNGKPKTAIAKITPKQSDDFWKLGMKIDENLKLHVYLEATDSGPVSLELI